VLPLLLLMGLGLMARPAAGQARAGPLVQVRSAETGAPLRGAQVWLEGTGRGGITNEAGVLDVLHPAPGTYRLRVRLLGYAEEMRMVDLVPGRPTGPVEVALASQAIPLAAVVVRAEPRGERRLRSVGFNHRRERLPGLFLGRRDIEARSRAKLSEVMRTMPGMRIYSLPMWEAFGSTFRSAGASRACEIEYYLDGVYAPGLNIDDVRPWEVEAMEVYRGESEIPLQFRRSLETCSVVLIWNRVD
jgi:hypothetical protein